MRKSTLSMLVLGTVLTVVGIFGTIFYKKPASDAISYDVKKTISYDQEELTIKDFPKNVFTSLELVQGNSNQIKLSGQLDLLQTNINPEMSLTDNTLSFKAVHLDNPHVPGFVRSFLFNLFSYNHLRLEIPKTIKKLTLNDTAFHIYNFQVDELILKDQSNYTNLDDVQAKNITVEGKSGVHLSNVRADNLTLDTTRHSLTVSDSLFNQLNITSSNTSISLTNTKVKEGKGYLSSGSFTLFNTVGNFDLKGSNADIYLQEDVKGNLDIQLTGGNISQIGSYYDAPSDTIIKATTNLGNVHLFDKKGKTYGPKNATYHWNLATEMGDIVLGSYDEGEHMHEMDEDDYREDMMDGMMNENIEESY